MTRFLLSILLFLCYFSSAQGQKIWTKVQEDQILQLRNQKPDVSPSVYQLFRLDDRALENQLRHFLPKGEKLQIEIPTANGILRSFLIESSRNMPESLAQKYPSILNFYGHEVGEAQHIIRGSLSPLGFHAVMNIDGQEIYIDPYQEGKRDYHLVYFTKDHLPDPELRELIGHDHSLFETPNILDNPRRGGPNSPFTKTRSAEVPVVLYQYDIAIAATGEYTSYWGGVTQALSAINVALDRINSILVRDAAIELHLVAKNDTLIFTDPATDPYTGDDAATLVGENPAVLNQRLGATAFDIGHVFTRGCTGTAAGVSGGVGTVCGNAKARGSSCQISTNDRFYVGVICHELGHQFGAFHTWNNCPNYNDDAANYNPSAAFEPGSGTTIMSYAGSCQDQNIAFDSDTYYHVNSIESILQYVREGVGATCAEPVLTENNEPEVNIPLTDGFYIPINTPFKLTAEGSDPDMDTISYCWEEYDKDFYISEIGAPEGNDPIFRSHRPTSDPTRYFPRLTDLIANRTNNSEVLPSYSRDLTFRCTVRDNNENAGGVTWKEVRFKSSEAAGPFVVTSPNDSKLSFPGGNFMEITWDVANTDQAPINCKFVNIRLSLDAGLTYPVMLAQNTLNDGSAFVTLPDTAVDFARIMVEAADNIFFDIGNFNFEITPSTDTTLIMAVAPAGIPLHCQPEELTFTIQTQPLNGYDQEVTLALNGLLPEGSHYTFSTNPVTPGDSSTLTIELPGVDATDLDLEVIGVTASADTFQRALHFSSLANRFDNLELLTPTDGTSNILLSTDFSWSEDPNVDSYDIEIATSPAFGESIVESASDVTDNTYVPGSFFESNELFFWHIRPNNACGPGSFLAPSTFHTASIDCTTYTNTTRVNISGTGLPTIESKIEVEEEGLISDINIPFIKANYQPVNSLRVSLVSPVGTEVILFDKNCGATVNMRLGFDDDAPNEIICPPDDGIVFKPINPLSDFVGESTKGTWTLKVAVVRSGFGASGALEEWSLEFCAVNQPTNPVLVTKDTLFVPPGLLNSITPDELYANDEDNTSNELVYTIVSTPEFGTLTAYGNELTVGSQFTQRAIETFDLKYLHNGADNTADSFSFVIEDGTGGFLPINTLPIIMDANAVVGTQEEPTPEEYLKLYPNPARDVVNLDLSAFGGKRVDIELINIQGQVLARWSGIEDALLTIPVQQLTSGLYVVKARSAEVMEALRFTKP